MRTAVVISTYEHPRWLRLALRAWSGQSVRPERLVVADDGSGEETRAVVLQAGAEHVWLAHEEGRFGKCRTVNAAVRRARELGCEHLVFVDGDCLPSRDFLARHRAAARPGRYCAGGVIRLSREQSEAVSAADVEAFRFPRGDKPLYDLRPRALGLVLDALSPRRTPWKGGNSSCMLADFLLVNGYDERFGWGSEDKELGERLRHAGVRGHSLRYSAPVYHLWHERPYVNDEVIRRNREMLAATRAARAAWTPAGIR